MDLVCITIDCAKPASVAAFWSEALGWMDPDVQPDGSGAVCRQPSGGPYLEFVRVPQDKSVKNRVHLGCSAGPLDQLDAQLTRLQALGATIAWEEEFAPDIAAVYRNVVLRDVEGNEFCLGAGAMPRPQRGDTIRVRAADPDDHDGVIGLAGRLADTTPPWRDRAAVDAAVRQSISALLDTASPDQVVLVADVDGEVVGVITVSERSHFTGAVDASIDDLAVAHSWEQRGVARALLEQPKSGRDDAGTNGSRSRPPPITGERSASTGHAVTKTRTSDSPRPSSGETRGAIAPPPWCTGSDGLSKPASLG